MPEKAADTIAAFKYRNAGQVCISPTRFYVQEELYNKFVARFTEYAKGFKMGDGLEKGITLGPLANPRRLDAMESFVNDAKDRGGKIQTGGSRQGNQGFFFQPTVITDVPDDSKIMTEEPFGPLAPIVPFKTFDEVVERANSLQFGLAAYAFTSSDKTAAAIGDAIQSGMVGVNTVAVSTPETPFGGVKESGLRLGRRHRRPAGLHEHQVHLAGLKRDRTATKISGAPPETRRQPSHDVAHSADRWRGPVQPPSAPRHR